MPDTLAQKVRAKFPGVYNDLDDATLDAKVRAKYPGVYDDLPSTGGAPSDLRPVASHAVAPRQAPAVPDPGVLSGAYHEAIDPLVQLPGAYAQQQMGAVDTLGRALTGRAGIGESLDAVGALTGGGAYLVGKGAVQGAIDQATQALTAFREGRYLPAMGRALAAAIPILGPDAAGIAEDITTRPKYGFGRLAALLGSLAGPSAVKAVSRPVRAAAAIPAERAAAAAMLERGIPVDLGTATGNRFVRGVQAVAENTPLGAMAETTARQRRAVALGKVGADLTEEALPGRVVTPETAGAAVRSDLEGAVRARQADANKSYGGLRDLEADPANQFIIESERPIKPPPGVTMLEAREARRIQAELEEMQYTQAKMRPLEEGERRSVGGFKQKEHGIQANETNNEWVGGNANAPVYQEIVSGYSPVTAAKLRNAIEAGLAGKNSAWFERVVDVARKRLAGKSKSATLPPEAGYRTNTKQMGLATDLQPAKAAFAPVVADLQASMEAVRTAPPQMRLSATQQAQAQALSVMNELMQLPDFAPVSAVDTVLSNLKRIVRGADSPWSRTRTEGLAARAVGTLEEAVNAALEQIGPEAGALRTAGREATVGKYAALEQLQALSEEPVKAYRTLTTPGDAAIEQLRAVEAQAPGTSRVLGRAFLEDLIHEAIGDGGFAKGARIANSYARLGEQTKRAFFPDRAHRAALDQFFTMTRKLEQGPNPSGTELVRTSKESVRGVGYALTGAGAVYAPLTTLVGLLGAGGLVKAFHSPRFVSAVVRWMDAPAGAPGRKATALRDLVAIGKSTAGAGAPSMVPLLAGPPSPPTPAEAKR